MKNKTNFINAQAMQKKHPDTFEAPTEKELSSLTIGNSVKVSHNDERFWVTITTINKDVIIGTVDNDLICSQPFRYGDSIKFKKYNIYSIYS